MFMTIGAGFVTVTFNAHNDGKILGIANETSLETARKLARIEGIPVGLSSGAAIAAALEVGARDEMAGKQMVVVVPSFAERYLSTALFEGI